MEAMRQSWTDDRLDDLNRKVDQRFDRVDDRFDQADREAERRFKEVDRRLDGFEVDIREVRAQITELGAQTHARLDSIQRSIMFGALTLTGGMIAGFAGMITLVATQT
jgi:hypothetical protein